jgi:hypothetical protein
VTDWQIEYSAWAEGDTLGMIYDIAREVNLDAPDKKEFSGWYYALRSRLAEFWPKNRRRKKVLCPLSLNWTDHPSGVSGAVWKLAIDGIRYRQEERLRQREGNLYAWDRWWDYVGNVYEPPTQEGRLRGAGEVKIWHLTDWLCSTWGISVTEHYVPFGWTATNRMVEKQNWRTRETEHVAFMPDAIWLSPYDEPDRHHSDCKICTAYLTKAQAHQMQDLVNAWLWNQENVRRKAHQKGFALLAGLAEGSLRTSDFDAETGG